MLKPHLLVSILANTLKQLESNLYNNIIIIHIMNKFISFAFVVCALAASVHCGGYGSYGGSAPAASAYNANSYILGPGPVVYSSPPAVYPAPPAYSSPPAYPAPSYPAAKPKYTIQPAYSHELYPGQNNYKSYHSAPVYSQVALPIVPSSPVAKLYVPAQQSYAASAPSYGGSGY